MHLEKPYQEQDQIGIADENQAFSCAAIRVGCLKLTAMLILDE